MTFFNTVSQVQKQFASSIAIASLFCAGLVPMSARAASPEQAPMLLAQEQNGAIAQLRCGQYLIRIGFDGTAASSRYTYTTKGLSLRNGSRQGNTYVFDNNDFEYRVTITGGGTASRRYGTGTLTVSHYGERLLTKQCNWT